MITFLAIEEWSGETDGLVHLLKIDGDEWGEVACGYHHPGDWAAKNERSSQYWFEHRPEALCPHCLGIRNQIIAG